MKFFFISIRIIYDNYMGRCVSQINYSSPIDSLSVSLEAVPGGLYIVEVKNGGELVASLQTTGVI